MYTSKQNLVVQESCSVLFFLNRSHPLLHILCVTGDGEVVGLHLLHYITHSGFLMSMSLSSPLPSALDVLQTDNNNCVEGDLLCARQ